MFPGHSLSVLNAREIEPEEIESFLEKLSEESELSSQLDKIEYLIENPYDMSNISAEDIASIPSFSLGLSEEIVKLIRRSKAFSYSMIADSLNLSRTQFTLLKYCTVLKKEKSFDFYLRERAGSRFSGIKGYEDGTYIGSEYDIRQKLMISYRRSSAGIIFAKSAGEKYWYDFSTFFVKSGAGAFDFILGDFTVESGMGGIIWKAFGARKGGDAVSPVIQYGKGCEQNYSNAENSFFRGIAIAHNLKINESTSLKTNLWAAYSPRSGTLDTLNSEIVSWYSAGYFRTQSEKGKYHTFNEFNSGGNAELNVGWLRIGAVAYYLDYDKNLNTETAYILKGKSAMFASAYSYASFNPCNIGIEVNRDNEGNLSFQSGLQYYSKRISSGIGWRYFPADFKSNYGYSFSANSAPNNHRSFYAGLHLNLFENTGLDAYCELFSYINPPSLFPFPERKSDLFVQSATKFGNFNLKLRVEYDDNEGTLIDDADSLIILANLQKTKARIELDYLPIEYLKFRGRIEFCSANSETSNKSEIGSTAFIEISGKPFSFLKIGSRLTYYSTPSYRSAIWEFESTTPGMMESAVLYGSGIKCLIFAQISIKGRINFWFRWKYFEKYNVANLGYGPTETANNTDKSLVLQLDLSF